MGVEHFYTEEDRYLYGPPVDLPCYLTFVISNSLPLTGMYRLCFLFKSWGVLSLCGLPALMVNKTELKILLMRCTCKEGVVDF